MLCRGGGEKRENMKERKNEGKRKGRVLFPIKGIVGGSMEVLSLSLIMKRGYESASLSCDSCLWVHTLRNYLYIRWDAR
jgi:hypothetical protein